MQCSECQSGEKFKQTRVNGGSINDSLKVTSSECQSDGKLKQAWVNGGRNHDSLKRASVAPSELWLRDDLEEVYALLFPFLGFGFRLAMSNVGWHVTQKFVILVPASRCGRWCSTQASLVTSVNTLLRGHSLRGFLSHQERRRHGRWRSHGSTVAQPLRLY